MNILGEHVREVAGEFLAKGNDALALTAEVTHTGDAQRDVTAAVKKWGKLTIRVNKAGIGQWVDTMDIMEKIWQ